MRVLSEDRCAEADEIHQLGRPLRLATAIETVQAERFGDNRFDRLARVKRCIGVLEDQLNASAGLAQFLRGHGRDVRSVEIYGARSGLNQTNEASTHGRLPTTGLAHQSQRASAVKSEGNTVDRLH